MLFHDPSLPKIKQFVRRRLNRLYCNDSFILERNNGKGISERAIVFRFAYYLQSRLGKEFFVDCDFNSSFYREVDSEGNVRFRERSGKRIGNTKRFIDIIIHKRDFNTINDFICFEIKKWNNNKPEDFEKDRNNLHVLTSEYGYRYGFHIIIHKDKNRSTWTIYENGDPIEEEVQIFEN